MIILRQGKAKGILENSINSALTAVETYNRPRVQFRIENYIILMIIAWTKLFHAYFQSEIGERYFYKEKNGRYKKIDGEKKAWELTECIKEYQKMSKSYPNLSDPVVANLRFFIGIRNKIEHRYWDSVFVNEKVVQKCTKKLSTISTKRIGAREVRMCTSGSPSAQHLEPLSSNVKRGEGASPNAQLLELFLPREEPQPGCWLPRRAHQVPARWRFMDWVRR